MKSNVSDRFDRLPASTTDRTVEGRPTSDAVTEFWTDRFGIPRATFSDHTFWEKGAGKIWAFPESAGIADSSDTDAPRLDASSRIGAVNTGVRIQALGMMVLRTRQEHWKPTTNAVQRFGHLAERNVIRVPDTAARRFFAGENLDIEWGGDWGYLIVAHDGCSDLEPIGVGLYVHGELQSMVPKGRRRSL